MFLEEERLCVGCKPKSPAELQDYLRSEEARQVMMEFFDGPAQELLTQMQTALARLKAEEAERLKAEVGE